MCLPVPAIRRAYLSPTNPQYTSPEGESARIVYQCLCGPGFRPLTNEEGGCDLCPLGTNRTFVEPPDGTGAVLADSCLSCPSGFFGDVESDESPIPTCHLCPKNTYSDKVRRFSLIRGRLLIAVVAAVSTLLVGSTHVLRSPALVSLAVGTGIYQAFSSVLLSTNVRTTVVRTKLGGTKVHKVILQACSGAPYRPRSKPWGLPNQAPCGAPSPTIGSACTHRFRYLNISVNTRVCVSFSRPSDWRRWGGHLHPVRGRTLHSGRRREYVCPAVCGVRSELRGANHVWIHTCSKRSLLRVVREKNRLVALRRFFGRCLSLSAVLVFLRSQERHRARPTIPTQRSPLKG